MARSFSKRCIGYISILFVFLSISQAAFGRPRILLAHASTAGRTSLPPNVTKAIYDSLGELITLLEPYVDSKGSVSDQSEAQGGDAIYASAEDIRDATFSSNHTSNSIADAISKAPYGQVIIQKADKVQNTWPARNAAMAPTQAIAAAGAPADDESPNAESYKSVTSKAISATSFRQRRQSRAQRTASDSSVDPKVLEAAAHEAANKPPEEPSNTQSTQDLVATEGAAAPKMAKKHHWWAGHPIVRDGQGSSNAISGGDVKSIGDLQELDDQELASIFADGEPDIPGGLPDSRGKFTFCSGRVSTSVFSNSTWPHGSWPAGSRNPVQNIVNRFWRGKVFYQDPNTNTTRFWNLLYSNSTVALTGNVSVQPQGLTHDGKPSVIVNYIDVENPVWRPLRDEVRRVGPSVWLGRVWLADLVKSWNPSHPTPLQSLLQSAFEPWQNATLNWAATALGLQGPNSRADISGNHYEAGDPFALPVWLLMDCTENAVPKLQYTSSALANQFFSSLSGYNALGAQLPSLNPVAGNASVENWALEAPVSTDHNSEPFILYPWKASDVGPVGYIKMPARFFEPVFGAWWLYNYGDNAERQTRDLATTITQAAIEFPLRQTAQRFAAPILNPLARSMGDIPNQLPSVLSAQTYNTANLPITP